MNYENLRIGFIGFGKMAQAIATGLLNKKAIEGENVFACANHYDKLKENCKAFGINPCATAEDVAKKSDLIFIAVKPKQVRPVLEPILESLKDKIIVSVAANLSYDFYEELLLPGTEHITTLPNLPVSIGEGAFLLEDKHSIKDIKSLEKLLSNLGSVEFLSQDNLDIAGILTGCGPAFAAMFAEALADAGVMHGLPRAQAYRLAGQMLAGTGKLIQETGIVPAVLKDNVCSPGGTTIIGVSTLERKGLRSAVIDAVDSIKNK